MPWPIRETDAGSFAVVVRPCTIAITALFLPQSGATVWLRHHRPHRYIEWWPAQVPMTSGTELVSAQVRDLVFDLQVPVSQFRQHLAFLDDHGADLYLMKQPVPDTLTLDGVPEAQHVRILSANGLIAYFHLPHANEVAWLETPERRTLEQWLETTDLSDWLEEVAA